MEVCFRLREGRVCYPGLSCEETLRYADKLPRLPKDLTVQNLHKLLLPPIPANLRQTGETQKAPSLIRGGGTELQLSLPTC